MSDTHQATRDGRATETTDGGDAPHLPTPSALGPTINAADTLASDDAPTEVMARPSRERALAAED